MINNYKSLNKNNMPKIFPPQRTAKQYKTLLVRRQRRTEDPPYILSTQEVLRYTDPSQYSVIKNAIYSRKMKNKN